MYNAQLILADGTVFPGQSFGHQEMKVGEVIVHTSMSGYQEVLSDPAYSNHIIVMTYPLIGNYGFNHDDFESISSHVKGLVVREKCNQPSNFRSTESVESYANANEIPAIEGIDTRKLTHHIRKHGTMNGVIAPIEMEIEEALSIIERDEQATQAIEDVAAIRPYVIPGRGTRVVLIDLGVKHGILRALTERDCHITVVPYDYELENILRLQPDGIIVSNGPAETAQLQSVVEMVKQVMETIPLFGIGLGHHVFAAACGADIRKKKNGRYAVGVPVTDVNQLTSHFTSMHQSEEIVEESLENLPLHVTEKIADDGSIARLQHTEYDAFSVVYNPESAPGPDESDHIFDQFLSFCKQERIS